MENHHVFMGKIVNINYKWPCSIAMSAMLNYQGVCVHVFSNCNFTAKAAIVSQTSGFVRLQEDEPYFCQFVLIHRLFQISSSFNIFRIQKIYFLNSKKQFVLLVLVFPYMQRASDAQMRQNHGPFEHLSFYPILSVLNGLLYMTIIWCTFMTLCWCIITIRILYT